MDVGSTDSETESKGYEEVQLVDICTANQVPCQRLPDLRSSCSLGTCNLESMFSAQQDPINATPIAGGLSFKPVPGLTLDDQPDLHNALALQQPATQSEVNSADLFDPFMDPSLPAHHATDDTQNIQGTCMYSDVTRHINPPDAIFSLPRECLPSTQASSALVPAYSIHCNVNLEHLDSGGEILCEIPSVTVSRSQVLVTLPQQH